MDVRTGLPIVGMVGGGQLARMTHQAAIALGQSLRVLAAAPDESAARVAADVVIGDHSDAGVLDAFAAGCDVVTFDHEHVPNHLVAGLAAAGHSVAPSAAALRFAQDKQAMRVRLAALGVPVPRWRPAATAHDIAEFGAEMGWPIVAKAARGGYDGRGVWVITTTDEGAALLESGVPLIVEERVPIRRELAAVVARSPFGQAAAWPVVETVQRDGICVEVIAPAPGLSEQLAVAAEHLALDIAARLEVVGVLAVELFETSEGLLVNELAMRPHNSAHWTIEGARTSQFEQHLRAVLDYPLGSTAMTSPWAVMANVLGAWVVPGQADGRVVPGQADGRVVPGQADGRVVPGQADDRDDPGLPGIDERLHHLMARWPAVKVHLYGKDVRPGRKIGHVTALGADLDSVRRDAREAAAWLSTAAGGAHPVEQVAVPVGRRPVGARRSAPEIRVRSR